MSHPDEPGSSEQTYSPQPGQPEGEVECYSGDTYAQEPRAVIWQRQRLPVTEIEARWRTPAGPAFRVQTGDGARFELQYDEQVDRWSIEGL